MLKDGMKYVPLVAAALLTLGACDIAETPPDAQYGGICVDQVTEVRLDDSACGDFDDEGRSSSGGSYFMWIGSNTNTVVPAHGQKVPSSVGTRTVPKGTPVAKGVPASGGTMSGITRGGFGAKAGASAGSKGGTSGGG